MAQNSAENVCKRFARSLERPLPSYSTHGASGAQFCFSSCCASCFSSFSSLAGHMSDYLSLRFLKYRWYHQSLHSFCFFYLYWCDIRSGIVIHASSQPVRHYRSHQFLVQIILLLLVRLGEEVQKSI